VNKLIKVQRAACLGITGAQKSTSTKAMETIIGLEPIEVYIRRKAAETAIRLKANGQWAAVGDTPHMKIEELDIPLFRDLMAGNELADTCPRKTLINKKFQTKIREKNQARQYASTPETGSVSFYTDGAKNENSCGAGIYSATTGGKSISIRNEGTTFQCELLAIKEAAQTVEDLNLTYESIKIFTDSQASIKSLNATETRSRMIVECWEALNRVGQSNLLAIEWVPSHSGVTGNEIADSLAKQALSMTTYDRNVYISKTVVTESLKRWADNESRTAWRNSRGSILAKNLWGDRDFNKSKTFLNFRKYEIRMLTGIITGHMMLRKHARRLGLAQSSNCRGCNVEEETVAHILCDCPVVRTKRLKYLGKFFFDNINEIRNIELKKILRFVKEINFLGTEL
jgi:ribonuclease HI